jgi:hypothetical protein
MRAWRRQGLQRPTILLVLSAAAVFAADQSDPAPVKRVAAFLHAQALVALHSNRVPCDYPVEKLRIGDAEGWGWRDRCRRSITNRARIASVVSRK